MERPGIDIESLSIDQRLELMGRLWDSLPDHGGLFAPAQSEQDILDRRLKGIERANTEGIPWNTMMRLLRKNVKASN